MRDLRYAIRVLLKAPVFTATAVLMLALCIGLRVARLNPIRALRM